jgi:proline iminopeptidase
MNRLFKIIVRVHVALFRATRGRIGSSFGKHGKMLLLTTTGNKSGKARTVPVMQFDDDGRRFVIASAGGRPQHPAWFKNLSKKPAVGVEVRGERYDAQAVPIGGEDRGRVWRSLIAQFPNFAGYQKKTSREIPVVELKRA